ncbi:hypothetical protein UFOVP1290_171 [uncultured Caudovirales phage]|uniref:Uncharacterized protein n=1 Tax=uncultured Caudovirales phage TaxID=2100421 RepID=A0A6J5RST4_9CAUD|nr:hypothetical protein UFOVP1290_171 [uncultured Caudovirales phage]
MITSDLDTYLASYGVKSIFLESGRISVESKFEEIGCGCDIFCDKRLCPTLVKNTKKACGGAPKCWVELSWGSGSCDSDKFDFAIHDFGKTPGQAIQNAINTFITFVKKGECGCDAIAKHLRIYKKIMAMP